MSLMESNFGGAGARRRRKQEVGGEGAGASLPRMPLAWKAKNTTYL